MLFQSIEAQKRALVHYNQTIMDDLCGTQVPKSKFIFGKERKNRIICEKAAEPDLIMWENFG